MEYKIIEESGDIYTIQCELENGTLAQVVGEYEAAQGGSNDIHNSKSYDLMDGGEASSEGSFTASEYYLVRRDGSLLETRSNAVKGEINEDNIYTAIVQYLEQY